MKYPDARMSLEARLPSSVKCWLGHELEIRGIDALHYTRYIISLLLQDQADPIEPANFDLGPLWFQTPEVVSAHSRKSRHRKTERKKYTSNEDRNKIAAVECLRSISDEDSGLENLVDELCNRLREISVESDDTHNPEQHSVSSLTEETQTTAAPKQDPAARYYAAFPALHNHDANENLSPTLQESAFIWKKNPIKYSSQNTRPKSTIVESRLEPSLIVSRQTARKTWPRKSGDKSKRDLSGSVSQEGKKRNHDLIVDSTKRERPDVLSINDNHLFPVPHSQTSEDPVTPDRFVEHSSWYTEPVTDLRLLSSSKYRLYKRGSISDGQEDSPEDKITPQSCVDDQPEKDECTVIERSQSLFDDAFVAQDMYCPLQKLALECSNRDNDILITPCQPDVHDMVFIQSNTMPEWLYEKNEYGQIWSDGYSSADCFGSPKVSELLTTDFESILESVKCFECEYESGDAAFLGDPNVQTTKVDPGISEDCEVPGAGGLTSDPFVHHQCLDGCTCGQLLCSILSSYNDRVLPEMSSVDEQATDAADRTPIWLIGSGGSIWNDEILAKQGYFDCYDWDSAISDGDEKSHGFKPSIWDVYPIEKFDTPNKSFELTPSECSAFDDVILPKIKDTQSGSDINLPAKDFEELGPADKVAGELEGTGDSSESEHLYFSTKTHFCPIEIDKIVSCGTKMAGGGSQVQDLFGGYTPTGTPYQEFTNTVQDSSFVPKFRVQKNSGKFVQTGSSLDADSCSSTASGFSNLAELDDHKIEYVIAILNDVSGPDVDAERDVPPDDADTKSVGAAWDENKSYDAAMWGVRSLWVSTDDSKKKKVPTATLR